jgi:hypothetical protein
MRDREGKLVLLEEYCGLGDLYRLIDDEVLTESAMQRYFGHVVCVDCVSEERD